MHHYFASEAVIPMRAEPREGAEMVSQLLFGDVVEEILAEGNWMKVRNTDDGYEGWVSTNMISQMATEEVKSLNPWRYLTTPSSLWVPGEKMALTLPAGTRIPNTNGENAFHIGGRRYETQEPLGIKEAASEQIAPLAQHFLYTPYLWGGKSSFGIDCSGLTQVVYRMCGIAIPRDSAAQQKVGILIPFGEHQAGDLAFFSKKGQSRVTHVGIVMGNDHLIHASGRVRIDSLLQTGIEHRETKQLTHELVSINRY